jgi:hypothetical protein
MRCAREGDVLWRYADGGVTATIQLVSLRPAESCNGKRFGLTASIYWPDEVIQASADTHYRRVRSATLRHDGWLHVGDAGCPAYATRDYHVDNLADEFASVAAEVSAVVADTIAALAAAKAAIVAEQAAIMSELSRHPQPDEPAADDAAE